MIVYVAKSLEDDSDIVHYFGVHQSLNTAKAAVEKQLGKSGIWWVPCANVYYFTCTKGPKVVDGEVRECTVQP